jgi:hypothetical protein
MRRWFVLIGGTLVLLGVMVMALSDPAESAESLADLRTPTADEEPTLVSTIIVATATIEPMTPTLNPTVLPSLIPTEVVPTATPLPQLEVVSFRGVCSYSSGQIIDIYASASGVAPSSRDDAGNTTNYMPDNMLDCNRDTAWRVEYTEQANPTLTFTFAQPVVVSRFGFVPGYDKYDPLTNQWRWYQNRRISEVSVISTYQDGQVCPVTLSNIPDASDLAWVNVRNCRPAQDGIEPLVTRIDVRVDYSRPPSAQPVRNFVVISDVFFEGFTYVP